MNPDDLLPTVTAIVKYDMYPHYIVTVGKLRKDGGVIVQGVGSYAKGSVLRVYPASEYNTHIEIYRKICDEYRKRERELRVDILIENDVDFVTVK